MVSSRIPLPKEPERPRPCALSNFDQYIQRAEEQMARARAMIEIAHEMCERAAAMRETLRLTNR